MTVQKPVQIALAIVLMILASIIGWQVLRPQETGPVYEGKTLQSWVQMLRAKDSSLKLLLVKIVRQQHFIQIYFTPAQEWNHRARSAFEVLGPQAKSAVPAIIQTVNQNISYTSRLDAIDALGFIGPSAQEAVPCLLECATNADSEVRCYAIFALGKIHSDPKQVVPVLTNALNDSYLAARIYALIALKDFGPEAKVAVPVLVEYVKADSTTRSSSALKAIDPEAAAKAGVK